MEVLGFSAPQLFVLVAQHAAGPVLCCYDHKTADEPLGKTIYAIVRSM